MMPQLPDLDMPDFTNPSGKPADTPTSTQEVSTLGSHGGWVTVQGLCVLPLPASSR